VTAAVAGTGAIVGTPAASAATVDADAWYILVNRHSGKALDVYDLATNDGARITQWTRNDGAWQQWQFVDSGDGFYRLRSRHSNKVLDVRDFSTADGAEVVQWSDHNGLNQQFQLADSDAGHVRLINRNSGKALEVYAWSTTDGARIAQWSDHGGANQQWQLVQVGATQQPPSYPNPGAVSGDIGVHDPTVARTPAGGYLLANTGNNVALKTSTDRTDWRNAGSAFPGGVPWAHPYTNGSNHVWAPDLSYENGQYYMYYSASTFGSNRSAIFLATSTTGAAGGWTNQGLVIDSQTSGDFNAIDPNLIIDDQGNWWLSFGSFWSGIKMIQLDPDTGLRTGSAFLSIAGRNGGAIEAPIIHRRGQYYYLYVSFDLCCRGADSTYRVMVGRSTSVTGPYVDRNGTPMNNGGGTEVLAGHGSINGPGHQEVINDNGQDVLFYHYYANNGASLLGINLLGYDAADWPFVF
jgi:arabinan endo-1,5-alpha-L-arabinosidase